MEWKKSRPNGSGEYLVSITIAKKTFNCIAHYDQETDGWFKYDPFKEGDNSILEQIESGINGWTEISTYMGTF